MVYEIGEFKGNKTITLKETQEDKFGFTFGIKKAKLILTHLDDIKKFVEENDYRISISNNKKEDD